MLKVTQLRTEYKINPIGIGTTAPRLSWKILSDERGVLQTAYQIKAANTAKDLRTNSHLVWDSGKTDSDQSIHVKYEGPELQSSQRIYWSVTVWDNLGNVAHSTEEAYFETGLLGYSEWKASWITPDLNEDALQSNPCPFLRKDFELKKEIRQAQAYVSALGLYQLHINGAKVSDELFTPGWTSYHHRIQYQIYDITHSLAPGKNAVGAILGDGWYRGYLVWQGEKNTYGEKLALLLQIKVTYTDGTTVWLVSDDSWKSTTGPILKSDIYNGETYDAREELTSWDLPDFNDSDWKNVSILNHSKEILVASEGPPVKITETITPVKKLTTPNGELVFDLGQNIVGWVQFNLKAKAGTKIVLQHAEVLDQEGNFYVDNLRAAKAEDTYIFKGEGIETYEPHFTFHGFRYVKVSGFDGEIALHNICGKVIHSAMEPIGNFECSNELINQLQKNIHWGLRGNFLDVPTDCPQRDERLGWTGDAQVFAPTACFNRNAATFFTKWMKDFIPDQKEDGSVPWVVPNVIKDGAGTGWSDGFGATGWADAAVIIPWTIYQAYGDTRILENQYDSMKGWIEYMIHHAGDRYIFSYGFHFGDWLAFAEYYTYNFNAPDYGYAGAYTEKDLIATAYFYYSTGILLSIAKILNKKEDEERYATIQPKIKAAFQKEFMTSTGRLVSGTQTAYILALSFGLIPDEFLENAAKRLTDDIKYFGHLTTGFLGTPLICEALTKHGFADLAYKLLFNERYPSWLYPVTQGATTIWERWDGIKPDGEFQTVGMNSFNHYAYGAVGHWLYTSVAGLNTDPKQPGYKHIIIKPEITDALEFTKAELETMYGRVMVSWKNDKQMVYLEVEIPANTTATVYLPLKGKHQLLESGTALDTNPLIHNMGVQNKRQLVQIGSGNYTFEILEMQ